MSDHTQTPRLLTDVRFVRLSLDEASSNGKIKVKGEFAKCGVATENKRIYPESIWNKEIGRLDKAIGDRRVFGEMDHPADGRTSLNRVSHIVTSLKVSKDGLVVGEAEVLPTEAGKNLSALLASGCKVGVSSRGYGSTKSNDKGEEVVQPDYKLVTFDFVAEPADSDAYPNVQEGKNFVFEGVDMNTAQEKAEQAKAAEFARKIEADLKNGSSNADVREEFSHAILDTISKMKTDVRAEVKAEMLADPTIGGAKAVVEQLKALIKPFWHEGDAKTALESKDAEITKLKNQLAERDLKIKTLEDDNGKLASVAKEAGYKFWLERTLANDPDAEMIVKAIGDVKLFAKADDLKARVEELKKGFQTKREESKKAEEARSKEIADATKKVEEAKKAAEDKVAKLEEALAKTLASEKALGLRMLAEQRLRNHPLAKKLRPIVEGKNFESQDAMEKFFDGFREAPKDDDELETVRARVRKMSEGGDEDIDTEITEDRENTPAKQRENKGDYNGLGISISELKKLSGNVGARTK